MVNSPHLPVNKAVKIVRPAREHQRLHRLLGTFWTVLGGFERVAILLFTFQACFNLLLLFFNAHFYPAAIVPQDKVPVLRNPLLVSSALVVILHPQYRW